jgi:hypothetical protein
MNKNKNKLIDELETLDLKTISTILKFQNRKNDFNKEGLFIDLFYFFQKNQNILIP